MAKKSFVRIHSTTTIQVTCGLQCQDVTNPDAHVPDRLKISPSWPTCCVVISEGSHLYPAEIAEWNTVKALARDQIITIGEYTDDPDEKAQETKNKLILNMKEAGIMKDEKSTKLSDIIGD